MSVGIRKPLRWAVVAIVLAGVIAGCGSSSSGSGGNSSSTQASSHGNAPNLWYINPYEQYPLFTVSQHLFQQAASKYDYTANVAGSTTINIPQQIQLIRQAVSSGAKGIIFCDLDPATYQSTIRWAQARGVVMVTTSCVDGISNYSVGTDNAEFGKVAAQTVAKGAGADAHVVVFMVSNATPNQVESYNAFVAYAKRHYPQMKVLAQEFDGGDASKTETLLSSLSQSYPSANAIWFLEGGTLPAVEEGLRQDGKRAGQMYVLGIDAVPSTLSMMKSGWISETLAQCYFWATPFAAELIMHRLAGHPSPQQSWSIGIDPVSRAQLPYNGCPASFIPSLSN